MAILKIVLLALASVAGQSGEKNLDASFPTAAPERWQEIEERFRDDVFVEENVYHFEIPEALEPPRADTTPPSDDSLIESYVFRLSEGRQRVDCTYHRGEKSRTSIQCVNASYYFAGSKPRGAGGWNIWQLKRAVPGRHGLGRELTSHLWHLYRALSTAALPLSELVRHPTFRVTSARTDETGNVVIRYSLHAPDERPGGTFYEGGELVFQDAKSWLPIAATTESTCLEVPGVTGRIVESWEWTELGGRPVPRRHTRFVHVPGDPTDVQVRSFENWRHEVFPDAEFTLSALGLPEPQWAPVGREQLWVWCLLTAGAVLIAVGLWLRRRSAL